MILSYISCSNESSTLQKIIDDKIVTLGRGEIIPKQEGKYPVYSSSAQNNGLFCYRDNYSFDEELLTWSVDGGGQPFLRNKHKFSITNVCGYAKILDDKKMTYPWLFISFWYSWHKLKFDYTTKAHPSVISKLYKIKLADLSYQYSIGFVVKKIDNLIDIESKKLDQIKLIKNYLLNNLFI